MWYLFLMPWWFFSRTIWVLVPQWCLRPADYSPKLFLGRYEQLSIHPRQGTDGRLRMILPRSSVVRQKLYWGYLMEQLYHPNKDDSSQELHPWISWLNLPIASVSSTVETIHSLYNLELYIALYSSVVFLNFLVLIIFSFLSLSFLLQEELFQFGGKLHYTLSFPESHTFKVHGGLNKNSLLGLTYLNN